MPNSIVLPHRAAMPSSGMNRDYYFSHEIKIDLFFLYTLLVSLWTVNLCLKENTCMSFCNHDVITCSTPETVLRQDEPSFPPILSVFNPINPQWIKSSPVLHFVLITWNWVFLEPLFFFSMYIDFSFPHILYLISSI